MYAEQYMHIETASSAMQAHKCLILKIVSLMINNDKSDLYYTLPSTSHHIKP